MVWIQINAFIILAGFELNASIAVNKDLLMKKEEIEMNAFLSEFSKLEGISEVVLVSAKNDITY